MILPETVLEPTIVNDESEIYRPVYEPVYEAENIMSTLMDNIYNDENYQAYLSSLEDSDKTERKKAQIIKKTFMEIKVFNTNIEPLFIARDLGILMGIANINSTIKNYNDTEKIEGYIINNGKIKKKNFLTRNGVYRILLNSRTKLSDVFRGFIYKLLDHMIFCEIDKLKFIMNQYVLENPNQVKESLLELHENVNKYKKLYEHEKKEREIWVLKAEEEHEKNTELEKEKNILEVQNLYDQMYVEQLKKDKNVYLDKIQSIKYGELDDDREVLDFMKKKFLKEIYIYAALPLYIEKIVNKTKAPENDNIIEEYNSSYKYSIVDFEKNADMIGDFELYYYINHKKIENNDKYEYIASEWVLEKNKYTELINLLEKNCHKLTISDSKKGKYYLFKTSLEYIRSICLDLLLH